MTRTLLSTALALATLLAPAMAAQEAPARDATATPAVAAIDINAASAAQFEELPGIGARTAQRIVEYRQKNGPFRKVEELMNVKGIGEKSFLKLKPYLSVRAPRADKPAGVQP